MAQLTIEDIERLFERMLKNSLEPVVTLLGSIETRLDSIETRMTRMEVQMSVLQALQCNSCARLDDKLVKIPLPDGTLPDIFPATLGALIVGGSELIPGSNAVGGWNREQSLKLILKYDPSYETDNEGDADEKKKQSARRRRLHLAKIIGVTPGQLHVGMMEAVL